LSSVLYEGNSTIYKGRRIRDSFPVAVKKVPKAEGQAEAKILRLLHEPTPCDNIIQLLDCIVIQDFMYLVFPFVEDRSSSIRRDWTLIRRCGRQLLNALDHCHAHGIVHLDVKPNNTIFDGKRLLLIDFGHALPVEKMSEAVGGTSCYTCPELLMGRRDELGTKIDIWSAAVVIYEWSTGQSLFGGIDNDTVLMSKVDGFLRDSDDEFMFCDDAISSPTFDLDLIERLLSRMFAHSAAQRPSAQQCLRHKVFSESDANESKTWLEIIGEVVSAVGEPQKMRPAMGQGGAKYNAKFGYPKQSQADAAAKIFTDKGYVAEVRQRGESSEIE